MKRPALAILFIALTALCACDYYNENEPFLEKEVVCLPVCMTATLENGIESEEITADFHYIPGTMLLDHIAWSNNQIHMFSYDASDRIQVVKQLNMEEKVQEEMWFIYNGSLVLQINMVSIHLDPYSLEPVDSVQTGFIEFIYEGKQVMEESRYDFTSGMEAPQLVLKEEYDYDSFGNIISSSTYEPGSEAKESRQMIYDVSKHPFSGLQYYFHGESFVNNALSKFLVEEGSNYEYEINLNEHGYPEVIQEIQDSHHIKTFRYSYVQR